MATHKARKIPFWQRYANVFLLGCMVLLLAFFLVFVRRSDREEISNVADETLAFMKSVCQRYDNYAIGQQIGDRKDVFDKVKGLSKLANSAELQDQQYLRNTRESQELDGIVVTDGNLQLVVQETADGNDGYALWKDYIEAENRRNIIKYKNKNYCGTVQLGGTTYNVVIVSRRDTKGLILGYQTEKNVLTDVYETSLEKTLDNNTFHKNPRIVVTDNTQIVASNVDELYSGMLITDCPIQADSEELWGMQGLVKMTWQGDTWYGKRLAYNEYRIYVFYPSGEVFNNMLSVVMTAIAVYALLCLILLLLRYRSARRYQLKDRKQLNTIRAIGTLFVSSSILHLDEKRVEGVISTPRAQAVLDETTELAEVARKLADTIIVPEYQQKYVDFLDAATMQDRLRGKVSISGIFQDNKGVWFATYLIPMEYGADGHLKDVLFASRDINDYMQKEKTYQDELRKTAHDAEKANAVKTSFLRRMSHDLRTPVNGIRGMVSMAEQSLAQPEQAREYLHKIMTSAEYLQAILEDILRMSKLESGKLDFEDKPYDLQKIIDDTADFIAERADEGGIHCTVDTSELHHTHVIGSPLHLRQILQNLLSNAVKFTPAGGSIHAVCREKSCDENTMVFEFVCTDTGIGISEEFQRHIFEPFAQEDTSAKATLVGTGLGLSIAKEIVDQRGGTITLESSKGEGSTFTVTLPLKLDTAYAGEQLSTHGGGDIAGIRALVVEDNDINMEIASYMLRDKGVEVTEVRNGKEAVAKFAAAPRGSIDVILMDIMMPEMDGLEATRTIRAMPRGDAKTVPIFAMTANAFVDDINLSIAAGMNEHLSKPLNIDDVVNMIYRYCRK